MCLEMNHFVMLGFCGLVLSTVCGFPQLIKIIKYKDSRVISLTKYVLLFVACLCYLIYALSIHDPIFVTSNLIVLAQTSVSMYFIVRFRNPGKVDKDQK